MEKQSLSFEYKGFIVTLNSRTLTIEYAGEQRLYNLNQPTSQLIYDHEDPNIENYFEIEFDGGHYVFSLYNNTLIGDKWFKDEMTPQEFAMWEFGTSE